jgi:hypothetical protein
MRRGGYDQQTHDEEQDLARQFEENGYSKEDAQAAARAAYEQEIEANKNSGDRPTDNDVLDTLPSDANDQERRQSDVLPESAVAAVFNRPTTGQYNRMT